MRNKEFQRNKSERNTWYYVNHPTEPLVSNMLQHVVNILQHDDTTITKSTHKGPNGLKFEKSYFGRK